MPTARRSIPLVIAMAFLLLAAGGMPARAAEPDPVYTHARLTSSFEEPDGKFYVRLKLLPRAKIPFTTQAFRVTDRAMVAGIAEGAWVKFTAKRIGGENILTSIHTVAECKRFERCD